ncbi:LytR/AlgR family response regulator transcription factor [Xanthovirga aplysinae]|uniref:LytR/AlgR family response regulator transcription factor n=1 Tax=Xanthovirga aplysinae TaxID=2529853 RepID=UPI0012BB62C4|nr:LytTR family DNA-binding domain-containing protein [Xanthovirga aplysinae]MTI33469.1 response regulator transcription factor [Xanthovirga aplysinae]
MNILIVEDEKPAAEKIEKHLKRFDPNIRILEKLSSIEQSVSWLKKAQKKADLLIMDIQLSDGLSFEIFSQVSVNTPVIFTTAFNQYAINAFEVNGIDYLLKPISYQKLVKSMEKLENLRQNLSLKQQEIPLEALNKALSHLEKNYKNRFMVKSGEHIRSLSRDQIDLFFADGRTVYLLNENGYKFIIDYKMESLEELLDPEYFFRINRGFILHIQSIQDVLLYSNSRLKIKLKKPFPKELIVSRDKVGAFKDWFNGDLG